MRTLTLSAACRRPTTGIAVVVIGVTTASWAIVHATESAARAAMTVQMHPMTTRDGTVVAPAVLPPVLATDSLWSSIGWTLTVLAWAAVCALATAHQARSGRALLPFTVGAIAVVVPSVLAFIPLTSDVGRLSWPGPADPINWSRGFALSEMAFTLDSPAALSPLVILLALAAGARSSQRPSTGSTGPLPGEVGPDRSARRRALLMVGAPALALWLGALVVLFETDPFGWGELQQTIAVAIKHGGSMLLLVGGALLISGSGRIAAPVLVAGQVAVLSPIVAWWWAGGSDLVLIACLLSAGATACAVAWQPVARTLMELTGPTHPPQPVNLSVAERSDPHERPRT
ncbi:MAG: hypothetical protein ACOH17_00545 [Cellulomonas sp.]